MEATTTSQTNHDARATPTRVGIVDDHPAITAAVGKAVLSAPDLDLVGVARTLADGLALAAAVDVLICDVQLDGRAEGLSLLETVHRGARPPAVIVLSGYGQTSIVRAAIERGAAGYLDKGAEVATIVEAIRTVAAGGVVFTAAQLRSAGTAPRRPSDRELQVIDRVTAGATNAEIGLGLGLSEKTIESHLRRLFDRYGVLSRTELAVLALQEGWVSRPAAPPG
jgi:DNA-binding NarL/FixJ family response regulator